MLLTVLNADCPRCPGTVLDNHGDRFCAQCGWNNSFASIFTHIGNTPGSADDLMRAWGIWLPLRKWHKGSPNGPAFSKSVYIKVEYWIDRGRFIRANATRITGWPFHLWIYGTGNNKRVNQLRGLFRSQVGLALRLVDEALREAWEDECGADE